MKNNRPDEFENACEFDKRMRDNKHKIKIIYIDLVKI